MGRLLTDATHQPLRAQLDTIMKNTDAHGLGRQLPRVEGLARRHPHSIRPLVNASANQPDALEFNCHAYTLGLRAQRRGSLLLFPDRVFIRQLIDAGILSEIDETDCRNGDIIFYHKGGLIEHSGVWHQGRVRSKWGTGHVWEHAVHEVPLRYGDEVRFYRQVAQERSEAAFAAFVRTWKPGQR